MKDCPTLRAAGRLAITAAATAAAAGVFACTPPTLRPVRPVEFSAPSQPDLQMRLILENVDTLGVLSGTSIEPVQGIDIEKVMGRLTDATSRSLHNLEGRAVVTQDEIRWHFKDVVLDSAAVFDRDTWAELQGELGIDALVYLSLKKLQARMTSVTPTRHGMSPTPGMNFTVDLEIVLLNLESGDIWRHQRHASNWQPAELQVVGGSDRTEQQLMSALSGPLRQFLARLAPPPKSSAATST